MNVKRPNRLYKSDRLNHIVSRMRLDQEITPSVLAEELKVSERTIYRDLQLLESGNALHKRYSRREGRYMLETELNLPPMTLTPSEAMALFTAAANPALSQDSFYAPELRSALGKVAQALSPTKEPSQEGSASLDVTADSIQRPILELIRRAMHSNRKLRIQYWVTPLQSTRLLTLAPYDLRRLSEGWCLVANCEEYGSTRPFKVSRIRSIELLTDRFRFPRRFSAESCFTRAWERFGTGDDDILVKLRFEAEAARLVLESHARQFHPVETEADGSVICTARVCSLKDLRWWILSYGAAVEVLAPTELREDLAVVARTLTSRYDASPPV